MNAESATRGRDECTIMRLFLVAGKEPRFGDVRFSELPGPGGANAKGRFSSKPTIDSAVRTCGCSDSADSSRSTRARAEGRL
jgi:hypothetical protein